MFLLNVRNLVIRFKWSGSEFHNFVPFIEKAVRAKDVLRKGILQSPFDVARLVDLEPLCSVDMSRRDMSYLTLKGLLVLYRLISSHF